jgi:hypothetical protein
METERSLGAFDDKDLKAFHEAARPTSEQHAIRTKANRQRIESELEAEENDFDPAKALIIDTLAEAYDGEISRLMGVQPGKTAEESLDPITLKVYRAQLADREQTIRVVAEALMSEAEKQGTDPSELTKQQILEKLDASLFGGIN